jgi:uncharacterized repeat protein (TIGR01451 family)
VWRAQTLVAGVDLVLSKSASQPQVALGADVDFTITVFNGGTSNATGVVVSDTLPSGLAFVSAQTSQGSYSRNGNVVTFTLGHLATSATAAMTLRATAVAGGSALNTAVVTVSEPDVAPANNQASATVMIATAGLTLLSPSVVGTNFVFSLQSQAEAGYTVEYNDDLTTTNWSFLQTMTGDGALLPCVIPMTNTTQRFYRVRQP